MLSSDRCRAERCRTAAVSRRLRLPHANEYYGFYDIFGKTASIIGTFLVATTTSLTGNASIGVLSIAILLAVALVFLLLQKDRTRD